MNQDAVLFIGVLLIVLGLPLALSTQSHLHTRKISQPMVHFSCRSWQSFSFWFILLQTVYGMGLLAVGLFLLVAAITTTMAHTPQLFFYAAAALVLLGSWRCFPALRLWWTYWKQDGQTKLTFYREQRRVLYANEKASFGFSVEDVVQLSYYASNQVGVASSFYNYSILTFADGRELLITSLVCNHQDLAVLLPTANKAATTRWYPWLPTDTKSAKLFGPYF